MATQNNSKQEQTNPLNSNFYDSYIKGKELYYLLGLLLISCYFIFSDFISFKKTYLFRDIGSDSINIYFPWLTNYSDMGGVPGWSFSQGMGQNVFPIWLGDFFSDFLTLFDKSKIPYGIAFMEILKIFLSGLIFYKFLKEVKLSNFSALIFSMLFAFSGFIILGGCWVIFSTEAVYIAIILYGFERWLNHQKFFWFVFGIMCLAFLQPFLLFPYSVVLATYIFARYFDTHEPNNKALFLFLLKTVGLAGLGVGIACYQLLPDVLQYLESPRVGGESSFFDKLKQQDIFGLADDVLRFTTTFRAFGSDMIGTGSNFRGWQNYLEAPLFYCGIFCLVAFPQFFSSLNKRQKWFYGGITVLFCMPILFPYFRYAFWAFSGDYFRAFSLVIVIFMVMFSARAINYIEKNNKINKIVLGSTVLVLLLLLYTPANQFKPAVNTSLRSVVTFLILAYAGLLYGLSTTASLKAISKTVLIVLCFLEVAYFSSITVNKRDVITGSMLKDKIGYNDYTMESIAYLKNTDKDFFRVNKDYSSGLAIHSSINDAKVQNFYGTTSYYSFNQKNYIKFLGDLNVIDVKDENQTRWAKGLGDRPILFSIASGKYWLSKRTDGAVKNMGFDSIAKFGDVTIFKNKFVLPFGFTYNTTIGEDAFKKLSPTQKDFCLLRATVIGNEDKVTFASFKSFNLADTAAPITFDSYMAYVNEHKSDKFNISKFSDNNIVGSISTKEPKVLFFSMPFDEGWSVKVNDEDAKLYRINAGLTGLPIKTGNNKVELSFEPRLKNIGLKISLTGAILFLLLLMFKEYRKRKDESK
ncbi:MAG: YfhO family protein [Bacteroidota bacterium]